MPTKNYFSDNRKKIQATFIRENFLTPLSKSDMPYSIIEKKNPVGSGKLRELEIDNIPSTDNTRPISYILDLEIEGKIYSLPPTFKTVEKAFLIFTQECLLIILVEMKSGLSPFKEIPAIEDKIQDSISRLSVFLPNYIFTKVSFNNYPIKYITLVFYNNDNLSGEIGRRADLVHKDLIKIFTKRADHYFVTDDLGETHKVRVKFIKNTGGDPETFGVNFDQIFKDDMDYLTSLDSEKTLP
jgi:hypothetical protein